MEGAKLFRCGTEGCNFSSKSQKGLSIHLSRLRHRAPIASSDDESMRQESSLSSREDEIVEDQYMDDALGQTEHPQESPQEQVREHSTKFNCLCLSVPSNCESKPGSCICFICNYTLLKTHQSRLTICLSILGLRVAADDNKGADASKTSESAETFKLNWTFIRDNDMAERNRAPGDLWPFSFVSSI